MTRGTDEAAIIAWIDGELAPLEAERVARAVAGDPALAALAADHRRLRDRLRTAFAPLAQAAPAAANVVPLTATRAAPRPRAFPSWGSWMPGALAACLVLALLGQLPPWRSAVEDRGAARALAQPIQRALDLQLSGEGDEVRVTLSFRNREGGYCRSFEATTLSGVACRTRDGWRLRQGGAGGVSNADYRMAAGSSDRIAAVSALIEGEPLDRAEERSARAANWQ